MNHTALVTGASRGFGRAITIALAQTGANVAVLKLTAEPDHHGSYLVGPSGLIPVE